MKKWKVWRHMIFTPPPSPLSQTVTLSQTPSPPLERDILYGRPHSCGNPVDGSIHATCSWWFHAACSWWFHAARIWIIQFPAIWSHKCCDLVYATRNKLFQKIIEGWAKSSLTSYWLNQNWGCYVFVYDLFCVCGHEWDICSWYRSNDWLCSTDRAQNNKI